MLGLQAGRAQDRLAQPLQAEDQSRPPTRPAAGRSAGGQCWPERRTIAARASVAAATPLIAEDQLRVVPTASTIVSASTASTAQARNTERCKSYLAAAHRNPLRRRAAACPVAEFMPETVTAIARVLADREGLGVDLRRTPFASTASGRSPTVTGSFDEQRRFHPRSSWWGSEQNSVYSPARISTSTSPTPLDGVFANAATSAPSSGSATLRLCSSWPSLTNSEHDLAGRDARPRQREAVLGRTHLHVRYRRRFGGRRFGRRGRFARPGVGVAVWAAGALVAGRRRGCVASPARPPAIAGATNVTAPARLSARSAGGR